MELYLAHITYRIPERLFWIPMHVYRQGTLLVRAETPDEAHKKVKDVKYYYTHELLKTM